MKKDKEKRYEKIITHRFGIEDIERGFELMGSYSDNVIKAVINP
jgi:threonine dehydrogenase-like Zn-dependent dehydrogenase